MDIQKCAPGAPSRVYVSQSHFLDCPDALNQAIDGLDKPSAKNDSTIVDIEPISGVVVGAQRRSQINLGVISGGLGAFKNLPSVIVPMIWLNVSIRQ